MVKWVVTHLHGLRKVGNLVQLTGVAWLAAAPACVCRLYMVAMRQAALVSDESALEVCSRRCAIEIDDLYLFYLLYPPWWLDGRWSQRLDQGAWRTRSHFWHLKCESCLPMQSWRRVRLHHSTYDITSQHSHTRTLRRASRNGISSLVARRRVKSATGSGCLVDGTHVTQVGAGCGFQRSFTRDAVAFTSSSRNLPAARSSATIVP